jgi:hypothetical protein
MPIMISQMALSAFSIIKRALKALPVIEGIMEEVAELRVIAEVKRQLGRWC